MYASFFGLNREPFSIAPDPGNFFMSERHRDALAHLVYGLGGSGGFVLLSGEIGTGKTTVCRYFLKQAPQDCHVAYIFNPRLTVPELLQTVCEEFHAGMPAGLDAPTIKDYIDVLNRFLLASHAEGRSSVLIIDEAQNLAPEVLEQLRLLTNLETHDRKLLQIVLIGQPELRDMLARPELEQLAQRVIARFHLDALSAAETELYVAHRLRTAGLKGALPFDKTALRRVHRYSRGIPRRINLLCDRALLGAFANGTRAVDRATVDAAAAQVFEGGARAAPSLWWRATLVGLGLVAGLALISVVSLVLGARIAPPGTAQPALTLLPPAAPAPVAAAEPPAEAGQTPLTLQQSWHLLAKAWGVTPAEGEPCQAVLANQLQCLATHATLSRLRQWDRPGILVLDGTSSSPVYAVLLSLSADSAVLATGTGTQTVPMPALASRWNGDFLTLWRTPPGYAAKLVQGDSGPAVEWLAAQLAALSGAPPPEGHADFNGKLKAQVRQFQKSRGLVADGRAGPLTLMQLNTDAGVNEPRLRPGS